MNLSLFQNENKKLIFFGILAIAFMILGVYLFIHSAQPPAFNGTDINIIFRYGVGAKNELDTFNGKYTRDMVIGPSITVDISLSNAEKERILQKMIENNFFDYPERFLQRQDRFVTPSTDYFLKVEYDSKIKEVSWDDNSLFENKNIEKGLQEITRSILEIIESKDEYKNLPSPIGGYI